MESSGRAKHVATKNPATSFALPTGTTTQTPNESRESVSGGANDVEPTPSSSGQAAPRRSFPQPHLTPSSIRVPEGGAEKAGRTWTTCRAGASLRRRARPSTIAPYAATGGGCPAGSKRKVVDRETEQKGFREILFSLQEAKASRWSLCVGEDA